MFKKLAHLAPFITLVGIAFFLRFYRLAEFITFLGDQGRDAIIIKRIVTLEKLTLIGAPTSIGSVFLGPFYYYLVAPFLAIWQFDPLGLAYGVAILSTIGLAISTFIVSKVLGKTIALVFLTLATVSYALTSLGQYSWNPNLLPYFAFAILYCFYLTLHSHRKIWVTAGATGLLLGLAIQLHYLAILLVIPMLVEVGSFVFLQKQKARIWFVKALGFAFCGFTIAISPLIAFDIRHDFVNFQTLLRAFSGSELQATTTYWGRLMTTIEYFFAGSFYLQFSPLLGAFILIIFFSVAFYLCRQLQNKAHQSFVRLHLLNVILYIFIFAIPESGRYIHYYGAVYLSAYLSLAFVLIFAFKNRLIHIPVAVLACVLLAYAQIPYLGAFKEGVVGNFQTRLAKDVATFIIPKISAEPYQIVALPSTQTVGHIRYFLELAGKTPIPEDTNDEARELFIMCYEPKCQIMGNAQWQIASFTQPEKHAKIVGEWPYEGFILYKLVHEPPPSP